MNSVLTPAHVGSRPAVGKHWPKSKKLVELLLRAELTAVRFCGCAVLAERML